MGLLDEDVNDDNPPVSHRYVGRTSDSVFTLETHFPERTLQMLDVRFANLVKSFKFNKAHDTLETRPELFGQVIKLSLYRFVQERDSPIHDSILYHLCNIRNSDFEDLALGGIVREGQGETVFSLSLIHI